MKIRQRSCKPKEDEVSRVRSGRSMVLVGGGGGGKKRKRFVLLRAWGSGL